MYTMEYQSLKGMTLSQLKQGGWTLSLLYGNRKQLQYVNVYMWHLEKQHWWTKLQGRNRHIDGLVDTEEEMNQESSTDIYTPPCAKTADGKLPHNTGSQAHALWYTLCDSLEGWDARRESLRREGMYIHTYAWFVLLYSRNQHNIVKQLFSNLKKLS